MIGNPPYVRPREITENEKTYLIKKYPIATNQFDLYHLFIALIKSILNQNGIASYIVPNAFLSNDNSKDLRLFILENFSIRTIVDCKQTVFEDANVESMIFCFDLNHNEIIGTFLQLNRNQFIVKNTFNSNQFIQNKNYIISANIDSRQNDIMLKIRKSSNLLSDLFFVMGGIKEYQVGKGKPPQTGYEKEINIFNSKEKIDVTFIPEIRGKHLFRFGIKWENDYVSYGPWLAEPRDKKYFIGEKILIRQIPGKNHLICSYTENDFVIDQSAYSLKLIDEEKISYKYALSLLNSKLLFWFFRNENNEFDDLFPKIKSGEIKTLPIKLTDQFKQKEFQLLVDKILMNIENLQDLLLKFHTLLKADFKVDKSSKKIEEFYKLTWSDFEKELVKNKVTLLGVQKDDWFDRFERFKKKALELKTQIDQTDKEIDRMVYELYGVTEEEIQIVENS